MENINTIQPQYLQPTHREGEAAEMPLEMQSNSYAANVGEEEEYDDVEESSESAEKKEVANTNFDR